MGISRRLRIQDDFGAVLFEKINGCYYNVVGLPLAKFYITINEFIQIAYNEKRT